MCLKTKEEAIKSTSVTIILAIVFQWFKARIYKVFHLGTVPVNTKFRCLVEFLSSHIPRKKLSNTNQPIN